MAFGDDDLAFILGDVFGNGTPLQFITPAGDLVTINTIADDGDQVMTTQDGDIVAEQTTFLIQTRDRNGLALEQAVTHGGNPYLVRDIRKLDDGALTRVYVVAG